ncbi:MAG: helix-turn-helix domain-containing protein [Saprospiraceae bacterium]
MKLLPQLTELQQHINHYWVVEESPDVFRTETKVFEYPGVRPEIILILKGHLTYTYLGKTYRTDKSMLASHISGRFLFDSSNLEQFIFIQFKPRSVASLLPFTGLSGSQLMGNSFCPLDEVFGKEVTHLEQELIEKSEEEYGNILDTFFAKKLATGHSSFLMEMMSDLTYSDGISAVLDKTGYSLSTLERHVKRETGLTPKTYLGLRKYKAAVEEINLSQNADWQHYVNKYDYFDQSHFIKTVKRYTGFTPGQLLKTPDLINLRPAYL